MTIGFSWKEIFSATMILFAVIDIIGSIPVIVDLRKKWDTFKVKKPQLSLFS